MNIKKIIHQGFVSLKFEFLPSISLEAQGVLTRMVNLPECDYIVPQDFQEMFPADNIEVLNSALDELVLKDYVYKSTDGRYAINKTKVCTDMQFIAPTV